MTGSIFLSAGVPDPKRGPQYAQTADTVAITAAVSSLIYVTMGRRVIVWGGQPAITPMVLVVAEDLDADYGAWVKLYQSLHFKDEYPEDNEKFHNVTFTAEIDNDRARSLEHMRERMFSEHEYDAAVFIGGMQGIIDEFELFRRLQPNALIIPVVSTGGAVLDVASRLADVDDDLASDRDYIALFHRHLGISVKEGRYSTPARQPSVVQDRYWKPR